MRAHLVLNVDSVDEGVGCEILTSGLLEQGTVCGEVGVSATEAGAQPGILILHQTFDAGILKHVEISVEAVEVPALFENRNRLGTAGVLRVSDFVTDEEVVLVD